MLDTQESGKVDEAEDDNNAVQETAKPDEKAAPAEKSEAAAAQQAAPIDATQAMLSNYMNMFSLMQPGQPGP